MKSLLLIAAILMPLFLSCSRPTPEEELMKDMQKILKKAYGEDGELRYKKLRLK